MVYSPYPPYEILRNRLIDYADLQRVRRFARYWDLVANSGNFVETAPLIWSNESAFAAFRSWSFWLHEQVGRTDSIALVRLMELLQYYLVAKGLDPQPVAEALWRDYQRAGRKDKPEFLRRFSPGESRASSPESLCSGEPGVAPGNQRLPKRQRRHQGKLETC